MMDDFLKLLRKKSEEQGGPKMNRHMEAKAAMAKELSDLLGSDLSEGVKKVCVSSDSKEGLSEALDKAKEALDLEDSEDEESMEDSEHESEESDSEEEMEDMSEVEDEIAKLEEQIKQLKKKKK